MKFNCPALTALLLILALALAGAAQHKAKPSTRPSHTIADPRRDILGLSGLISRLMSEGDVQGLSIAWIRDGKVYWASGFGVKNAGTKEIVDLSTMFEAASLSKPVFAYAVLKMVERGELDLDTPLSKYLPAYIENDERLNLITARRVLSHTTGFPNWRPEGKPLAIMFTPGDRFSYSGEGFVYLQKVVEHLTGQPLNEVMRKEVFAPLGMQDSSYVWQDRIAAQMAVGHSQMGKPLPQNRGQQANAAASLRTTPSDYARFVIAVMNGTGLKETTAQQMLTPQVKLDEGCVNCLNRKLLKPSPSLAWGLGVGLQHTAQGDAFWHWGDNGGFKDYVVAFSKPKTGVIIFTNSDNGLGIIPEIVKEAMGGDQPAFSLLNYEAYNSPSRRLRRSIEQVGVEAAIRQFRADWRQHPDSFKVNEGALNSLGYSYLRSKKIKEAIEIFKLNVEAFPNSSNVYDSLAEAYMENGDKALAIQNYKKSIELNPDNANGVEMLKRLEQK
ncbi:MAG TPA: serine hydrolase [Blastocatellia bacterium]|nr:serine hydrolase [Blastocatellia bacterium]